MADYITRRGDVYHFKRYVPTKLVDFVGLTVWRETLHTRTEADAKRAAQSLIAATNEVIRKARDEHHRRRHALTILTPDERSIVEEAGGFGGLKARIAERRDELVFVQAASDMLATISGPRSSLTEEGIDPDRLAMDQTAADARVKGLRAQDARDRSIHARRGLKPSQAIPADEIPPLDGEQPAPLPDIDLSKLAENWIVHKQLSKQHGDQYRYPVRLFREWHGALPLRSITKAHIRDWRDALRGLPRSTAAIYRDATMRQAIALYGQHVARWDALPDAEKAKRQKQKPVGHITPQTAAKHLAAIKTLLKFAVSEGDLENSPAEGITFSLPKEKFSAQEVREGFTLPQRVHLFTSLAEAYKPTEDGFWIPLVGLYQAMRIEEICQLEKRNIRQDRGVWVIDVTDDGEDQKVKNRSSVRTIPLAAQLIDRGFLDHVARATGQHVFSTLEPDKRGRRGGPYGKRFGRHLRTNAKITDHRLTFHSLRGTWKDAARDAGVPMDVQEKIMGHTYGGNTTAAGYGSGHSLPVLADWMAKVDPLLPPPGGSKPN